MNGQLNRQWAAATDRTLITQPARASPSSPATGNVSRNVAQMTNVEVAIADASAMTSAEKAAYDQVRLSSHFH